MLTDKEIDKIADRVRDKVIDKQVEIFATTKDVNELKEDMREMHSLLDHLVTAVDRLVKPLEDLRLEYAAVAMSMDRHERWIREIAAKVGVALTS